MASFQDRVTKLERRHRTRNVLPLERRKQLCDMAVGGDRDALEELNRHRKEIHASAEQRAAATAAALRADH